jgi:hypothetical protein
VFAAGAVCLLVATGAANAAPGQPDAAPALTPAAWADVALTRCRAEAEHWRAEDAALATRLSAGTPPREQASFLDREHAARALARRNALRGGLARLGTLTFGIDPKVSVDGAAPEPLRKVHEGLLAGLDICELEAVEATIVLGLFDVPFEAALAERLTAEGQFDAVDARIRERLTAGDSLEQIYVALRPASEAAFLRYLDAVVVAALAGHVAEGQPRDPREAGRRRPSPSASRSTCTARSMRSKGRLASRCRTAWTRCSSRWCAAASTTRCRGCAACARRRRTPWRAP